MKNTTIKSSVWRNKDSTPLGNGNAKNILVKAGKRKIDYNSPTGKVSSLFKKDKSLMLMGLGIMLVASSGLPASPPAFASTQNSTTGPQQTQGMSTSTNATTTGTNIILVHGAWADGSSSWSKVIPTLKNAGHRVIAVQLPLHSLADDVATVNRAIEQAGGPVLLVGHSYGGFVITNAAYNNPNVTGLVYVAGWAPDEGESINDHIARYPPEFLRTFDNIRPDSGGFAFLLQDKFRESFAQDVDPAEADIMAVAQKPPHESTLSEKSGPPAWRQLPTWYQVSEADRMIYPDIQRQFAERMNATTISVNASHASMVSHPNEIAQLILNATGGGSGG